MMPSVAAWIPLSLAAAAWAQGGPPVFHATSDLVLLDVQVLHNRTNTTTDGLKAKDFDLREDGAPQKISFFGRDQLPLSVVLLFDLTQSDQGILHRLAGDARTALDHLKPEDEVAVMVYAAGASLVDGFTRDHARTAEAIGRAAAIKSSDAAFFNEAVYQAGAQLDRAANPSSRRVVLWLTDNMPNYPTKGHLRADARGLRGAAPHTAEEALRKLHESGTVVMPLLLKDRLFFWGGLIVAADKREFARENPGFEGFDPGDAYRYAELTGGFAAPMRVKGVEQRVAEVIDSLRARYTIGYRPAEQKPPGTFCRLRVALAPDAALHPQEWRVLARAGYYRK